MPNMQRNDSKGARVLLDEGGMPRVTLMKYLSVIYIFGENVVVWCFQKNKGEMSKPPPPTCSFATHARLTLMKMLFIGEQGKYSHTLKSLVDGDTSINNNNK